MADLAPELVFHRKWWWDPIDMEIFKELEDEIQTAVLAVSLQTQAAVLRSQAEGLEKIGSILGQSAR
jgi:hypothetical protein